MKNFLQKPYFTSMGLIGYGAYWTFWNSGTPQWLKGACFIIFLIALFNFFYQIGNTPPGDGTV